MIKAGIIGSGGYTAGELIRILIHHPEVELSSLVSGSQAGKPVSEVHRDLIGDCDLAFDSELKGDEDVIFLCSGHGKSETYLQSHPELLEKKIIDLSSDFRLKGDHDFVYGLPELNRASVAEADHIANPGCFATCIQLGLLPLAASKALNEDVHVTAITGSTGAGQQPTEFTHFSWRNSNLSVYKAFRHQHLDEIMQSLRQEASSEIGSVHFIPVRGPFTRGILAASQLKSSLSQHEVEELYRDYYSHSAFVHYTAMNPDLKQVVNTNKCLIHAEKEGNQLLLVSVIDNLLKGASGQAVQNMNLMFGLEEDRALRLKGQGY